eukprot:3537481-Prymnesium_polylepis.1
MSQHVPPAYSTALSPYMAYTAAPPPLCGMCGARPGAWPARLSSGDERTWTWPRVFGVRGALA